MWVQAGAVALCGGDPTVKSTALELAATPAGGARTTPQAPAGAAIKQGQHAVSTLRVLIPEGRAAQGNYTRYTRRLLF